MFLHQPVHEDTLDIVLTTNALQAMRVDRESSGLMTSTGPLAQE
jgi:hypothetical protein